MRFDPRSPSVAIGFERLDGWRRVVCALALLACAACASAGCISDDECDGAACGTAAGSGGAGGAGATGGTGGTSGSGGAGGTTAGAGGTGGMIGSGGSSGGAGGVGGNDPDPPCDGGASCADSGALEDSGVDGGPSTSATACTKSSECVAIRKECCPPCGAAAPSSYEAIRADHVASAHPECAGVACPTIECAVQDLRVVATCDDGECTIVDLLTLPAASCVSGGQCSIRASECCECGASLDKGHLIAIRDSAAYADLVCDPETACGECAPVYPGEVTVSCAVAGYCKLNDSREAF